MKNDLNIQVDRKNNLVYPNWVKQVMHPKLENIGPTEYHLKMDVERWFLPEQSKGIIWGQAIYDYMNSNNFFPNCLGLVDLLAIQGKGVRIFRKLYGRYTSVYGWKSAVQGDKDHNDIWIPHLYESVEEKGLVLGWDCLYRTWSLLSPALIFKSASFGFEPIPDLLDKN